MREDSKKVQVVPAPARVRESTLTLTLPDPKIDKFDFMNASLRLHSMRQYLSSFSIAEDHDRSGLDYQVFLKHMIGIKTLKLDGAKLDFVKTTSAIFLVADRVETMDAVASSLPDLDAGRRYVLSDGKERIHLCRFTGQEFERIEKGAKESVDVPELRAMLGGTKPLVNGAPFDVAAFSAGIKGASVYKDDQDRTHYILDHDDGATYTLYSGVNPNEREENPLVYVGTAGKTNYYVFRVEVIG